MQGYNKEILTTPWKAAHRITGGFAPNGSSAPISVWGAVKSVVHTATGKWTVTLNDQFKGWVGLICASHALRLTADDDPSFLQFGAISLANGTVVIRAFKETAYTLGQADIAADAGNLIYFDLELKGSGAPDGSGIT